MYCHLTTADEWESALREGAYAPDTLAADGFVHLSEPEQVEATARRFFSGRSDIVLLTLDPEKLGAPVVFEDLYGHGAFPHLYGPIPLTAVVDAQAYREAD